MGRYTSWMSRAHHDSNSLGVHQMGTCLAQEVQVCAHLRACSCGKFEEGGGGCLGAGSTSLLSFAFPYI